MKQHGAIRVVEAWLDEQGPQADTTDSPPAFDGARLIAGGFVPMLNSGHAEPQAG